MVTSPVASTGNPALASAAAASATTPVLDATSSAGGTSGTANAAMSLTPTDFINMMITQLKNQDPMQPTSNSDLLAQMSQIGQLQSQQTLQTSLQGMVLQNQIGSAANLIGKGVRGLDTSNNPVTGTVNSVHVTTDGVSLELDNGISLPLSRVTDIQTGTASGAAAANTAASVGTPPAGVSSASGAANTAAN